MEYCDTKHLVILKMVSAINWTISDEYMQVLESSSGTGKVIIELLNIGVLVENIDYCELDQKRATKTLDNTGATFVDYDFLKLSLEKKYNLVISVPPFQGDESIDHAMKAYQHLEPGGQMVFLMPDKSLEVKEFRNWAQQREAKMEYVKEQSCSYNCNTFILDITKP